MSNLDFIGFYLLAIIIQNVTGEEGFHLGLWTLPTHPGYPSGLLGALCLDL